MIPILLYALLGLFVGMLLNRAADNLPLSQPLSLLAAPHCPYCGREREPWEQSGVLAFVIARGNCPGCHAPLPLRAPVLELITAFLFSYLYSRLGPGLPLLTYSLFTALLLLITVIDLEHRLILNVVVLPATLLALVLLPLTRYFAVSPPPRSPGPFLWDAALGALIGYVVVLAIYLFGVLFGRIMSRRRGKPVDEVAFGMGDVKLAGLVGALVGFTSVFSVLFYTIILGGIVSFVVIVLQLIIRHRYSAFMAIPYGPFFTITTWIFMALSAGLLQGLLG